MTPPHEPEDEVYRPRLIRSYTITAGRTAATVDLAMEATLRLQAGAEAPVLSPSAAQVLEVVGHPPAEPFRDGDRGPVRPVGAHPVELGGHRPAPRRLQRRLRRLARPDPAPRRRQHRRRADDPRRRQRAARARAARTGAAPGIGVLLRRAGMSGRGRLTVISALGMVALVMPSVT